MEMLELTNGKSLIIDADNKAIIEGFIEKNRLSIHNSYLNTITKTMKNNTHEIKTLMEHYYFNDAALSSDEKTSYQTYEKILSRCVDLCKSTVICADIGLNVSMSDHGILGFAVLSAGSIQAAIELFEAFHYQRMLKVDVDINTGPYLTTIIINPPFAMTSSDMLVFDTAMFAVLGMAIRISNLEGSQPITLNLPRKRITPGLEYKELLKKRNLNIDISFESDNYGFKFSNKIFESNARFSQQTVSENLNDKLSLLMDPTPSTHNFPAKVKSMMYTSSYLFPNQSDISSELGITTSTLRRKLKEFDLTYIGILEDARKEFSMYCLAHSSLSIQNISCLMNYNDTTNFIRAFKKWTLMTPNQYRLELSEKHHKLWVPPSLRR